MSKAAARRQPDLQGKSRSSGGLDGRMGDSSVQSCPRCGKPKRRLIACTHCGYSYQKTLPKLAAQRRRRSRAEHRPLVVLEPSRPARERKPKPNPALIFEFFRTAPADDRWTHAACAEVVDPFFAGK